MGGPALQYAFSVPNYLQVRAADRAPGAMLERRGIPGLRLIDLDDLPLPGPDWVRLRPRLAGICGSDMAMLTNRSGPSLMPFVSFPLVPGHEVVADVIELGDDVEGIGIGDRVTVDPVITCAMRKLEPCPSCARGQPGLCTRAAEGELAPGMLIGFCRDLPGGWSSSFVAHRSQIYPVPAAVDDRTAVLIEPLSVAVHAILRQPPQLEDRVLIIGGGSIGLLVLNALRMLGHGNEVTILARHPRQAELAQRFGATHVIRGSAGDAATTIVGARAFQPLRGPRVYAGGFDLVIDCAGTSASVDAALRVAGPHGRILMVGCAAELRKLDLTFLWARELTMSGSYVYGREESLPGAPHTFDVTMTLLQEHPERDLGEIVTHVVPLTSWREAFAIALSRRKHQALKVSLDCRA